MKSILFEDLKGYNPTRSSEQLVQIVRELKPDLMLRAATRSGNESVNYYDNLKTNILAIKKEFPNTKIIGNLYFQVIDRTPIDDITNQSYTEQQAYDQLSFNPTKFGIPVSKQSYQCFNCISSCNCVEVHTVGKFRFVPDITIPEVQQLYIHQAERLIETGIDGIWIDGFAYPLSWMIQNRASSQSLQSYINAALITANEIKKFTTIYNNPLILSTWYYENKLQYYRNSPYFNNKLFDFLTISAPSTTEMTSSEMTPLQNYDKIIQNIKDYQNNVPIVAYIDWSFNKHQMWHFSQWYPDYINCCDAQDSTINREKRYNFQVTVLKKFTEFFKSKGISWAYPVHGGGMCTKIDCTEEVNGKGPCCAKSFGQYNIYDAQAPEFNTYSTIKELMNPSSNLFPILIGGGLLGFILLGNKRKKKQISTRHDDFVS